LNWSEADEVPLTIYDWILPRGKTERLLREAGLGLIVRLPGHRVTHRQVEILTQETYEKGSQLIRRTIRTPKGEVWQLLQADTGYGTSNWIREHFIKRPEDYRVMEFYYEDMVFQDNFDAIREAQRRIKTDGLVILRITKSAVQEMLYQMMGPERLPSTTTNDVTSSILFMPPW